MNLRLSFSGGGFRATFFCLGAYRRLFELGFHNYVSNISSVSGGSITAGQILYALADGDFISLDDFDNRVTKPLIALGQCRLRNKIMKKVISPTWPRQRFSQLFLTFLDQYLFRERKMQDLPLKPEWSANATCLNTGKRFRFKQNDMGGNLLGVTQDVSDIKISFVVACSASFPMMFAPLQLTTKGRTFYDKWWTKTPVLVEEKLPDILHLTDGGIYDNLGSESIIQNKEPFLIFDASGFLEEWERQSAPNAIALNWRPLDASLDQIVLLRRRLLYHHSKEINGYILMLRDSVNQFLQEPERYGSLSDRIYDLPPYNQMTEEQQFYLGRLRTDFDGFHEIEIESLMWAGAVRVDIAIKRYLQHFVDKGQVNVTPGLPNYPDDKITETLKRGTHRSYILNLHKNL